jgi:F-type H+-transporting ATPase subunit delta
MRQGRVAQRYAGALLSASVEGNVEKQVAADVETVKRTIAGSRDLQLLLKSPVIRSDKKQEVLRAVFSHSVGPVMLSFLELVAEKGRESALPDITEWFERLRNERLGNLALRVTSATDLSSQQMGLLKKRFEEITKKNILLTTNVDASLKGGFLARVGDTVFDGTIKRQLEIMRQRFLEGNGVN